MGSTLGGNCRTRIGGSYRVVVTVIGWGCAPLTVSMISRSPGTGMVKVVVVMPGPFITTCTGVVVRTRTNHCPAGTPENVATPAAFELSTVAFPPKSRTREFAGANTCRPVIGCPVVSTSRRVSRFATRLPETKTLLPPQSVTLAVPATGLFMNTEKNQGPLALLKGKSCSVAPRGCSKGQHFIISIWTPATGVAASAGPAAVDRAAQHRAAANNARNGRGEIGILLKGMGPSLNAGRQLGLAEASHAKLGCIAWQIRARGTGGPRPTRPSRRACSWQASLCDKRRAVSAN